MAVLVKTINGLAYASVKTRNGVPVASLKTINGLDVTSGGFTPASIPGLNLWLEADSLSGSDGDLIATWPDLSGNGNDALQGTSGDKPKFYNNIINGLPALNFPSGDARWMEVPTLGDTEFCYLACSFVQNSYPNSNNNAVGIITKGDAGTNSARIYVGVDGLQSYGVWPGADFSNSRLEGNGWNIIGVTGGSSSGGNYYKNGASDGSWAFSGVDSKSSTYIGRNSSDIQCFAGYMYAIVTGSLPLSSGDRHSLDAYFGTKLGITITP